MKRYQLFHILVLLGFSTLISIGLFHEGWKSRPVDYILIGLVSLFMILIFRQFFVWKIEHDSQNTIILSSCFGLIKHQLDPILDFKDVTGSVEFKVFSDLEIAKYLTLITSSKKFNFYSKDYSDFDSELKKLFLNRKDLLNEYQLQLRSKRKKRKDLTWIFLLITLILIVIFSLDKFIK